MLPDLYYLIDITDRWILTKTNKAIKDVIRYMDKYDFNNVGDILYKLVWEDFCDNYIELSKTKLDSNITKSVLLNVLTTILKMLHPFIPFVTDEIYDMLPIKDENIMISSYPSYDKEYVFKVDEETIDKVIEDIKVIRNLKVNNNIAKDSFVKIDCDSILFDIYKGMLKIKESNITKEDLDMKKCNYKSKFIDITFFCEEEKIDKSLIEKEIESLSLSIEKRRKLLSNENYVNKAPQNVVELDRKKLKDEEERLLILKDQLK